MKFETAKTIFLILVAIAILGSSWVGVNAMLDHYALKNKLVEEQMVILKDSIVSNRVVIDTKVLEDRIGSLDRTITAIVKERDQEITDIGKSVAKLAQTVDLINRASDKTYKGKVDKQHYEFKKIYGKDTDGKQFPVAWVMFYPNQTEDKQWKSGVYPLEYHNRVVIAENAERTDSIIQAWVMNNQMKEVRGREFPIKVDSVEWIKRKKETKEWYFNPRLSLGGAFGEEMYPNLGLSMFSYGRTKTDMDWRILQVGVGADNDDTYFHFSPAEYNIGHWLPLVDNIFVGPFVGVSSDEDASTIWGMLLDVPL